MSHQNLILKQLDSDILQYILENQLQPGDRLPALSNLSAELNISVSKLREQLEVARILGIVDVRPRTGIRCKQFDFMPILRLGLFIALGQERGMFELYRDLRIHVEAAYWRTAIDLLTDDDKQELRGYVQQAWSKLRGEHIIIPHNEHRQFHLCIFRRLEHPFVQGILEAYWEAYEAIELNLYADYGYHEQVWQYHQKIMEEIEADNAEASLAAFIEHTQLLRRQPNSDFKSPAYYESLEVKGKQSNL